MQNPTSSTLKTRTDLSEVIKLGIDVHASNYVVVKKTDSSAPERPKKMSPEAFLRWITQLKKQCYLLYTCYEAGPFGYGLHRKLEAIGVTNYVIRPINWDTHGKKVKTDARDALQMVLSLDGYLRGNDRSFSVVRVPQEMEERKRSLTRQRQSLVKERARAAKQGRSHGLYYGQEVPTEWWKPRPRASKVAFHDTVISAIKEQLDVFMLELLEPLRLTCEHFSRLIIDLEERLETLDPQRMLAQGMGVVLYEQMEREVCDWNRFKNRKTVSSFTGLCPSEDTSANRRFQGSVNKHGNPRLRHMLIECAWSLMRWNTDYQGIKKWRSQLDNPKTTKGRRKQIIVAIARQFAVDWWRIRTGQCDPSAFGSAMKKAT